MRKKRWKKRYVSPRKNQRRKRKLRIALFLVIAVAVFCVFRISGVQNVLLWPIRKAQALWLELGRPDSSKNFAEEKAQDPKNALFGQGILPQEKAATASDSALPDEAGAKAQNLSEAAPEKKRAISLNAQYTLEIKMGENGKSFSSMQQLNFQNQGQKEMKEISLLMPQNDQGFRLENLLIDGKDMSAGMQNQSDAFVRLRLDQPIMPLQSVRITMTFGYELSDGPGLPSNDGRSSLVSGFYPVLAAYDGENWLDDEDLAKAQSANYFITLHPVGGEYTLGATLNNAQGAILEEPAVFKSEGASGFAFAQGDRMRTGFTQSAQTTLNFFFYHTSDVNQWRDFSAPLLEHIVSLFGDYPYSISMFQGEPSTEIIGEHGMIFVRESLIKKRNDEGKNALLKALADVYLEQSKQQNKALADLLARYVAQSYAFDFSQYEATLIRDASGEVMANEIAAIDALPSSASSQESVLPSQSPAPEKTEGLPDADVLSLMGLRNDIGASQFDSALKQYVLAAGQKSFADCFEGMARENVEQWVQAMQN